MFMPDMTEEFSNKFFEKVQDVIDSIETNKKVVPVYEAAALAILDIHDKKQFSKSDGKGDRGIDYYQVEQNECEIWQFKCRDTLTYESYNQKGSPDDIKDLNRILDLIKNVHTGVAESNKKTKKFLSNLGSNLIRKANEIDDQEYYFTIKLFLGCSELTNQAKEELSNIKKSAADILEIKTPDGPVAVEVKIQLIQFPDIIEILKKQENPDWFDEVAQKKSDKITLQVQGALIDDKKCQIFFARAYDLIDAYTRFGYRIFEPNVRCYLQASKVNSAIKNSLKSKKSIRNFRYLNNGVTIFYENINKNKLATTNKITFGKPGVVNGLQTIKTLSESFKEMTGEIRDVFMEDCYVQIRAFKNDGKIPVDEIIISTNNQNKMNQRNLESNSDIQKNYETSFGNRGWFYERKDGAWDAFCESKSPWPGMVNKTAKSFGTKALNKRRVLSNEDVAVAWLAFTGYSDIARSEKTKIFENENLKKRCFETVPGKHGFHYSYERNGARNDETTLDNTPDVDTLIVASLCHLIMKNVMPTKRETDNKYIKKYNLGHEIFETQQAILLDKADYVAELMMVSSPLTFVELVGYIFFENVLGNFTANANSVLQSPGMKDVFEDKDFTYIKDAIKNDDIKKDDFIVSLYFMWRDIWTELAGNSNWRSQLSAASSRPSFAHTKDNREKIILRKNEFEDIIKKNPLTKIWSKIFDDNKTITNIIRRALK